MARGITLPGAVAGMLAFMHGAAASSQSACTALSGTSLTLDGVAQTLSLTAVTVPAGSISQKPRSPAFCEINAVVSSNANADQSQIAIGVWLPETRWNGRFLGTGNGGYAGSIVTGPMKTGLLQGYAVANTDMGTGILFNCISLFCGSREGLRQFGVPLGGLLGDAAAIDDFGYGATHLMTLAAKQLIQEYYGSTASYSYFHGCSTGGGQALGEAQRYPADYDGILAGSPAYDRTHLITGAAAQYEVTHFAPDAYMTEGARALAHAGVLAACAGHDGGLATDEFLTKPALCKFNATSLQCSGAPAELPCDHPVATGRCTCLTADETISINQYWAGSPDSHGRVVDPGYERGAEVGTDGLTGLKLTEPAHDSLDYWAFGEKFHWQSFFRTVSAPEGVRTGKIRALDATPVGPETFDTVLNARNADLAAFNEQGGKLILYAGYADPVIPSADTIDYYNQAVQDDPDTPDYVRFYLAPGMWHCEGGPGVDAFGNQSGNQPPRPKSAADDVLAALVAWREEGAAPGKIIGTHYVDDEESQGIAFQRPLCPYPQNARYKGRGDVNAASSFRCAPGDPIRSQKFGKGYGPY